MHAVSAAPGIFGALDSPDPVAPWMPSPAFPVNENSNATGLNWYKQAWELFEPECKDSIVLARGDAINTDLDERRVGGIASFPPPTPPPLQANAFL